MTVKQLQIFAWSLVTLVTVVAVVAWGQGNGWQLSGLSIYQIFPLLGLLAFSIMWSHYISGNLRLYFGIDRVALSQYFKLTSGVVLVALLLHPGLLAWQLWRDGLGLPPGSGLNYVQSSLSIYIVIGMISWLLFLAFELRHKYGKKTWWKFVQYGSDLGMVLIFLHGLKLGGQLQTGWFQIVWYFYGITLLIALGYAYYKKITKPKPPTLVKS